MSVKHDGSAPQIKVEMVTPDIAAAWLGTMRKNRRLRQRVVDRYAREMVAGKWQLNGESVKFDSTGKLIDGQHRLQGIVEAGKLVPGIQVPLTVVRNVNPDAMITLDTGVGRSFGDWSTLEGREYTNLVGPVARWWYRYETGSPTVSYVPTHQELDKIVNEHPQILESVRYINSRSTIKKRCVASVQGFVHAYASEKHDSELATLFMDTLDSGLDLREGNAIHALRKRLVDEASARRPEPVHVLAWTIKAWNAWLAGENTKRITWLPAASSRKADSAPVESFPRFEIRKARDTEANRTRNQLQRQKIAKRA